MNDRFLEAVGVETVEQAMKDSLKSALGVWRGSKIYKRAELKGERKKVPRRIREGHYRRVQTLY